MLLPPFVVERPIVAVLQVLSWMLAPSFMVKSALCRKRILLLVVTVLQISVPAFSVSLPDVQLPTI